MRLLRTTPTLSMEAIDHQDGDFYNDLTAIVRDAGSRTVTALLRENVNTKIAECIKKYTNLSISIEIVDSYQNPCAAWIIVPVSDVNHILLSPGQGEAYQEYFKTKSLLEYWTKKHSINTKIDLKNGKVYGDYTKVVGQMTIGDEFFNAGWYNAEEAAAIILHEVGHYFTYLEFTTSVVNTNFVLKQMADRISVLTSPKEREIVIKDAMAILNSSTHLNAEELSKSEKPEAVSIVILKDYITEKRNDFGQDIFNESSWEAMADQFANRQGAGRALLMALDKITRRYGDDIAMRGKVKFYLVEAIKIIFYLLGLTLVFTMSSIFTIYGGYLLLLLVAGMVLGDSANTTYARLPVRYERIRADMVDRLKNRNIGKIESKMITDDIAVIDKVMETIHDKRQWVSYIAALLFSSKREYYKAEAISRDLEKLGNSDFFIHAAKLKDMAS